MQLRMNISTRVSILSLVIIILLVACGTSSTGNTSPTISLTDVNSTAQSVASALFAQTMAAIPTSTVIPTNTMLPLTPTKTPLPFMALDGLRVAYIIDDNLYVQDSGKPAIQLTHGVKDRTDRPPLISDDGQKIIFYRVGESNLDSVYVINADGTGEQVMVNPELLSAFGKEYDKFTYLFSLAFVPDTHLLLFNTYQQGYFDPEATGWLPIVGNDLFVVNTDIGEIKQLKAQWLGGNFLAAPNGKWVAVQTLDHIDVIDTEGRIIRPNLVIYDKIEGHVIVPMAWTRDSNDLIVLPSEVPLFAAGATVGRTVWRYSVNGGSGTQIKLNPPPVYSTYAVSPDGKWIAYIYATENNSVADSNTPFGLYLANLRGGTSQLLYPLPSNDVTGYSYGWSIDNTHFLFANNEFQIYMGNIYGEISLVANGFPAFWIDSNHYLVGWGIVGEIGKQELVRTIEYSSDIEYADPHIFVFLNR